jgi:Protein of unknown function (DUF4235)
VKIVFLPVSVLGGLAAGFVSKKLFELAWSAIDDNEPPDPKHRLVDRRKLAAALLLEGAIFRFTRGAFDHGTRHGFARLTGSWPGEESPESE